MRTFNSLTDSHIAIPDRSGRLQQQAFQFPNGFSLHVAVTVADGGASANFQFPNGFSRFVRLSIIVNCSVDLSIP